MRHRTLAGLALVALALACGDTRSSDTPAAEPDANAEPREAAPAPADRQVAEAVSPLPDALRAGATVLGYTEGGDLETLRRGANPMICLADEPGDDRWHVACYHESLEPFMARGRDLRAEGVERDELEAIRRAEIETGELEFPDHAAALYSLTGPPGSFDPGSGTAPEARRLFVMYTPYATSDELGLSAEPSRDRPWLMNGGEPWAHIMVSGR